MAARIRLYNDVADNKLVRFKVGKANMEPLAVANRKGMSMSGQQRKSPLTELGPGFFNIFTIAVWLGTTYALIEYMKWWPKPEQGIASYLLPLPAFASTAAPILALLDW